MAALLNRAKMTTATTGTGTVTLGSASTGYLSLAEAGAVNATSYAYLLEDGDDFEFGNGTYTSSGTTFSRDTVTASKIAGTAGTTKLTLSGTATLSIVPKVADLFSGGSRRAITSADTIVAADNGGLVEITSGTFTLAFTAAATIGSGFSCVIFNSGTGDVTLDPNSTEQIDGLTSWVLYPGGSIRVYCTGSAWESVLLSAMTKTFTSSGTFTKPGVGTVIDGIAWGGGGSGGSSASGNAGGGGGGGSSKPFSFLLSALGTTETVTIGAGGASVSGTNDGNPGGNTTLGSLLTAYGGGAGASALVGSAGGGGGGGFDSAGSSSPGTGGSGGGAGGAGSSAGATPAAGGTSAFGGGGGSGNSTTNAGGAGGSSVYGGGGGGGGNATGVTGAAGGASTYGGGGGGGASDTGTGGAGGTSMRGGNGGAGGGSGSAGTNGTQPGGGGGGSENTTSGAGGAGQITMTVR